MQDAMTRMLLCSILFLFGCDACAKADVPSYREKLQGILTTFNSVVRTKGITKADYNAAVNLRNVSLQALLDVGRKEFSVKGLDPGELLCLCECAQIIGEHKVSVDLCHEFKARFPEHYISSYDAQRLMLSSLIVLSQYSDAELLVRSYEDSESGKEFVQSSYAVLGSRYRFEKRWEQAALCFERYVQLAINRINGDGSIAPGVVRRISQLAECRRKSNTADCLTRFLGVINAEVIEPNIAISRNKHDFACRCELLLVSAAVCREVDNLPIIATDLRYASAVLDQVLRAKSTEQWHAVSMNAVGLATSYSESHLWTAGQTKQFAELAVAIRRACESAYQSKKVVELVRSEIATIAKFASDLEKNSVGRGRQLALLGTVFGEFDSVNWNVETPLLDDIRDKVAIIVFWRPFLGGDASSRFDFIERFASVAESSESYKLLLVIPYTGLSVDQEGRVARTNIGNRRSEIKEFCQLLERSKLNITCGFVDADAAIYRRLCLYSLPSVIVVNRIGKIELLESSVEPSRVSSVLERIKSLNE